MKRALLLALAILSLVLLGCPPKEGGTSSAGNEILVGEYASMSGPQATFGQTTHEGITLAVEEINAAGGINGRKIKILLEDDQSKQIEAANVVTKLISQSNVVAVLGEVASSCSIAAGPICQNYKVPMITPSSTNPEVTRKGDYVFRMCFVDSYQGENQANFAANYLHAKKAAVLVDVKSDYSTGLSEFFQGRFKELGGTIVANVSYANGDSDFKAQLTRVKAANPDILYVPGYYTDIGQIAIQARDLGMTQPLVGGDGWESPKLIEIGGKALEGCYYSNHYFADDPAPAVRDFVTKYTVRFKQKPGALAALGYDATKVLANALKRCAKIDGPTLRDEIAKTKDYAGVTGTITLGPDRNPIGKKLVVVEIKNGQLALAATIDPNAPATGATATTGSGK
ncbi:MAG TPA: ABC transporter substrate-binding protein [Thermoanaerobaculia bacterium]|nr:ABC transporter substrate-binding protein [Thermoanaerobaculia bacterium]